MVIPNCSDSNKKLENYYGVKITSKMQIFLLLKIKMIHLIQIYQQINLKKNFFKHIRRDYDHFYN